MPNKFISNSEVIILLEQATTDELLALTKIFDEKKSTPFSITSLQEKISECGGHSVANLFRGQGTGYLDILNDVADSLKIKGIDSYDSNVKYYDEIYYIKNEKNDTTDSEVKRIYDRKKATQLGLEYASNTEDKIIIELIKMSYEFMVKQKEDNEDELLNLKQEKSTKNIDIKYDAIREREVQARINLEDSNEKKEELEHKILKVQKNIRRAIERENKLNKNIISTEKKIKDIEKRIDDFNNNINEVAKKFDVNNVGTLTGTAGIMMMANLGGFATYTFLTSMMSFVSMGTLGFGVYTAATSLLSIMIGPIGWTGLFMYSAFSLGQPTMTKLMPIVAIIGAIRQRIKYSKIRL